jgi:hypothetical protein
MLTRFRQQLHTYPFLRRNLLACISFGKKMIRAIPRRIRYFSDYYRYKKLSHGSSRFRPSSRYWFPQLNDAGDQAGKAQGHYFHQDLLVARKIYRANPVKHFDIGSRLDGFIAHLLTFREVTQIDIRQLSATVPGLTFIRDDATLLSNFADNSVESISALHSVEHFGLGRYGDPINPSADLLTMQSMQRVLKPGGKLYFSVPVGRERVEFNAHRIYSASSILNAFASLQLVSFSYVDDAGALHENSRPGDCLGLNYGCGIFEFTKF